MNESKIPEEATSWESIDIYLFNNGQFNSPPRKYHLTWKELSDWNATTRFLAHSQYDSTVSNIVLYTLDGKKIIGPLELHNEAAYVAVIYPEDFICSGYDIYLIKASRSWEKRQERLSSNSTLIKPEEIKIFNPQTDTIANETVEGVGAISPKKVLEKVNENQIKQNSQSSSPYSQVPSGAPKNTRPKRNIKDIQYNDIIERNKNLRSVHCKKDQLLKKRNSLLMNKVEPGNLNKVLISRNDPTPHLNNNRKIKDVLKQKLQADEKNPKINHQIKVDDDSILPVDVNDSRKNIKKTEPITTKYSENDNQSPVMNFNGSNIESKLNNNKFENIHSPPKSNNTKIQERNIDVAHDEKHINIFLNIKLNGFNNNTSINDSLNKSNTTLMSQKISKLNIDVVLCKSHNHFCDNIVQPCYGNNVEENENIYTENKSAHCLCTNKINAIVEAASNKKISMLNSLVPIPEEQIHRDSNYKETQTDNKLVQTPSCTNLSQDLTTINSGDAVKNTAQEERSLQSNVDKNSELILLSAIKSKDKVENFTQTDFSNTLLQAIHHEDGRYTFHLPPLSLLKQYNINDI